MNLAMLKRSNKVLLYFAILGINLIVGCEGESESNLISVFYNETQCSDPWGFSNEDPQLIENLEVYFDSLNVTLFEIEIVDLDLQIVCSACDCPSGRRINALVEDDQLDIVTGKGFRPE